MDEKSQMTSGTEVSLPAEAAEEVQLPAVVNDPRPALGVGIAIFLVAGIIISVHQNALEAAAQTCWAGAVCGALGWGVFAWQRTAVRRGAKWVQDGVDD